MHLNSRSIDLPFDRRRNAGAQRFGDRRRGIREHRLHRPKELQLILGERRLAVVAERCPRDSAEISGHHRGATNPIRRHSRRLRDCLEENSFERALSHFAYQ
jgi:hypothetical protein